MLVAPRRGTVYGVLLNHLDALAALGDAVHAPPYRAPPKAPVLYIKPRNTWVGPGEAIVVPSAALLAAEAAAIAGTPDAAGAHAVHAATAGETDVEIGATLGLVIGRTACRVDAAEALGCVAGCAIVGDLSLPHASRYRPALRYKARDTFCTIGPTVAAGGGRADDGARLAEKIDAAEVVVAIDGRTVQRSDFTRLVRSPARLLAEISAFMTLVPGDILMLGVAAGAPRARAGQHVAIAIEGFGRLENPLVAEAARP